MLMTPSRIYELLQDRNLQRISEATGVAYGTVQALARSSDMNPTASTLAKLTQYFEAQLNDATDQGQ